MNKINRYMFTILFLLALCHSVVKAEVSLPDQNDANKILFDLRTRAKTNPESRKYVFSAEYIGTGNPRLDCTEVLVRAQHDVSNWQGNFPRTESSQELIYILSDQAQESAVDSFSAAMEVLAASGEYATLSYIEDRFGPKKIKSYKFDFFRSDGTKIMTRWFEFKSGQELGVATYDKSEKINLFKFNINWDEKFGDINEDHVPIMLTYHGITGSSISLDRKYGRPFDLNNLNDVQVFAMRILKYVEKTGDSRRN